MTETSEYYQDKVAVVTGGASGIGLALCETMLTYGASRVVLADVNDENLAREVARLEADHPGRVLGLHCDVSVEAEVQELIREAAESGDGHVDLLFNNAGRGFMGLFDDLTNEDWESAFALNFYGPLYGVRAVLPIMRAQGGGHIINIISGIAWSPEPQQSRYAATKAALNLFSLALRYELWDEQIRVTSATPGTTLTGIWKDQEGFTPAQGVEPPAYAQPADQSARTILAGVAQNQRLVFGDEADATGAKGCFNGDNAAGLDEHYLDVARKRREGILAF